MKPCPHCGKLIHDCSHHCHKCAAHHYPNADPVQRLWSYIDKSGGPDACWPWTGRLSKKGYAYIKVNHHEVLSHRYAYELTYGPIPKDMKACHKCDNTACCNPSHIFIGTQKDNVHDAIRKGRMAYGDRSPHRLHPELFPRGEEKTFAKLTEHGVRTIRILCSSGISRELMAQKYGVSYNTICQVVNRKAWKHIP